LLLRSATKPVDIIGWQDPLSTDLGRPFPFLWKQVRESWWWTEKTLNAGTSP